MTSPSHPPNSGAAPSTRAASARRSSYGGVLPGLGAFMPAYSRLARDVDQHEEDVLDALVPPGEDSSTTGSVGRTRSARRAHPKPSWAEALAGEEQRELPREQQREEVREQQREQPAPPAVLGASSDRVLAPQSVLRTACLVNRISSNEWLVAAGEAVAHFLAANGPPEIVRYNLQKVKGARICEVSVRRLPFVLACGTTRYHHHDFADLLELTEAGKGLLRVPEAKQPLVYRYRL